MSSDQPAVDLPVGANELVAELLARGSESRVDYKAPMSLPKDPHGRAKLAKHVIGLSNRKDGGDLLIGVDDTTYSPIGLTQAEASTWDAARVTSSLSSYSAPPPVVQIVRGTLPEGKLLVAVHVVPFAEQPLVCIKSLKENDKWVIRSGALYIRAEGTETKEITTESEMRELLDRAYIKKSERLLHQIKELIDAHWPGTTLPNVQGLLAAIDDDLAAMAVP
jgi:predicted HTH transcriptional regulator